MLSGGLARFDLAQGSLVGLPAERLPTWRARGKGENIECSLGT